MSYKTAFFAYLKGEKSQEELESYRRASGRIDELDAAIVTHLAGKAPWQAPQHQEQAVAFAWIARGLATIANTLLETDEREDPSTAGYLPLVTFGQAKALYQQVPGYIQRAWEALANPRYKSDRPLPLPLGPRIEADGKCPLVHLKGIQAAAKALEALGEVKLNGYVASIRQLGAAPPAEVASVLDEVDQIRARARAKVGFSNDQLAALAAGENVTLETHEEAETRLWEALCDHFLLGQFLADPDLLKSAIIAGHNATGRQIAKDDRWFLTDVDAARDLKGTKFGEQEIREFWARKGWRTTPREERYIAQTNALLKDGGISVISRWSTCPFAPVFQTIRPVAVLDQAFEKGTEFYLEMNDDEDELKVGSPRFKRTSGYEEEHEEGHVSDPSKH
ncbi:MAG: hypothetical protein ACAI25_15905 [Planctomycetota bacterium]